MNPSWISGLVVLALTGYFGYHVGYVRPRQSVQQLALHLQEAQQEQAVREEVSYALNAVERERARFAPSADPDWLLQEVSGLAKETGITVSSFSPQRSQANPESPQLLVTLQVEATYHQLGQFLSLIELAEHVIRVEHLELTPRRTQGKGTVQARVVLSTLYLPPLQVRTMATER